LSAARLTLSWLVLPVAWAGRVTHAVQVAQLALQTYAVWKFIKWNYVSRYILNGCSSENILETKTFMRACASNAQTNKQMNKQPNKQTNKQMNKQKTN
jgi:hypothetical protein